MKNITQADYENILTQLQQVKKYLNSQRIAHQTTLSQLQLSHQLNEQLQNIVKTQSYKLTQINKQLVEKSVKFNQMGQFYENQLMEIKQLINVKDRQLHSMRNSLIITDYNMIKLRIINQLQQTHQQQIQQITKNLQNIQNLYENQQKSKQIHIQKYNHQNKQIQRIQYQTKKDKQQQQCRYIYDNNRLLQKIQNNKYTIKQLTKQVQLVNKKHNTLLQKYQIQINKAYDKPQLHKVQYIKNNPQLNKLSSQLQQKQIQIQNWKIKYNKQSNKVKNMIEQYERKLRILKQQTVNIDEYHNVIQKKDKEIQHIKANLQAKIRNVKQQSRQDMKRLERQYEMKILNCQGRKDKNDKQNMYQQNGKLHQNCNEDSNKLQYLQQNIRRLEQQNSQLKKQNNKNTIKTHKPQKDHSQLKNKLTQANQQIVSLLLEKVGFKKQLTSLNLKLKLNK